MKIVFPELNNPNIQKALKDFPNITPIPANSLEEAAQILAKKEADSMIAGIDAPTRDVILACKKHLNLVSHYITSCFVAKKQDQYLIVADGGVCKLPDQNQLLEITEYSARTAQYYLNEPPKIAMLSYSTAGSGGTNNPDLEKIYFVIEQIRANHPEFLIDGEMQLDAAVNPQIGQKKFPNSPVAGFANVLICPDLNSANIFYKSLEQFGGWTMAGPILQGFDVPVSDLSRGSTTEDVKLVIDVIQKIYSKQNKE
jgi:phosphotransacetylase